MIRIPLHLCMLLALAGFGITGTYAASLDLNAKAAEIDRLVDAKLAKEKIEANAPITDEIFLRRIYLDVAGRIPSLKETTDFLADTAPDKRSKLIDKLLASDG